MSHREPAMTNAEFRKALRELHTTPYRIASRLGVSRRQCHRYASGETSVPGPVSIVLRDLIRNCRLPRLNKEPPG